MSAVSETSEDGGRRERDGAPGEGDLPGGLPSAPECPFCRGTETELMNAFGAHASVSTYWCRDCRSPFELMRWRGGADAGARPR